MGYRCPVCAAPQADGEHLANHLAFTAMLHGDEHEAWLDAHAPGWTHGGPDDLVPTVTDHADPIDFETVFDGPPDRDPDGHDHERGFEHSLAEGAGAGRPRLDDEAREILEEARELTERMYEAPGDEEE